jgi:preprotein translocase subunit SecD
MDSNRKNDLLLQGKLKNLQQKVIKRGLDLQGGMYLVLEVDLINLFEQMAVNKDEKFNQFVEKLRTTETNNPDEDFYNLLDNLAQQEQINFNRYYRTDRRGNKTIREYLQQEAEDGIDKTLEILRNRIDQFGVAEPNIQKIGRKRIIIELPGIQDIERAKELIGKTALLEFKLLKDDETTNTTLKRINDYLKFKRDKIAGVTPDSIVKKSEIDSAQIANKSQTVRQDSIISLANLFGERDISDTSLESVSAESLIIDKQTFAENPFYALFGDLRAAGGEIGVPESNLNAVKQLLFLQEIQKLIPKDSEFLWSNEPTFAGNMNYYELYLVKKEPELTGSVITDAKNIIGSGYNPATAGKPEVTMTMNNDGSKVWSRVTGANIGNRIAIIMDNKVMSAPVVRSKIPSGESVIEGMRDMNEAKDLSIVLRAGALPAPVGIIEERTVGPSLGIDSIKTGSISGIIGLTLTMFFMIFYYRFSGLLAVMALLLNIIFTFAVLAGFHATLTLPGIAGIILTFGMAVDANVLIFERIREEIRRGKTIRAAIDAGYTRAFITIFDSNLTTILTAVVLYQFGTGSIRGFAVTLTIGIACSMFTAIVFTRLIFDYITEKYAIKTLSI